MVIKNKKSMTKVTAIILFLGLVLISIATIIAPSPGDNSLDNLVETYTNNSIKVCNQETYECKVTTYTSQQFIKENNEWKHISEAISLKDSSIRPLFLEEEEGLSVKVIDYNFTSITVDLSVDSSKVKNKKQAQEIKIWKLKETKEGDMTTTTLGGGASEMSKIKSVSDKVLEEASIEFKTSTEKQRETYEFSTEGSYLEFGDNSTVLTLTGASMDTYIVSGGLADSNYGAQTNYFYGNRSSSGGEYRSLLKFDLSSIPQNTVITSANFRVYKISSNGDGITTRIHPLNRSWVEGNGAVNPYPSNIADTSGGATWNKASTGNNWATAGGDFISNNYTQFTWLSGTGADTYDIKEVVQYQVSTGVNDGFIIKYAGDTDTGDPYIIYSNQGGSDAARLPKLEITYKSYPNVNITFPLNATGYASNITAMNYSVTSQGSALSVCKYSIDGAANQTLASCGNLTGVNWGSGIHTLIVYANNTDGLTGSSSIFFVVDSLPPEAVQNTPANNTMSNTPNLNFTVNLTDNIGIKNVTLEIYNSSGLYNSTSSTFAAGVVSTTFGVVVNLVDNVYTWFWKVFDFSSLSAVSQNYTLEEEGNPPVINLLYPLSGNLTILPTSFNVTAIDAHLGTCQYSTNLTSNNTVTCNTNISITATQGTNTWYYYANDTAGNSANKSVTFFVDSITPIIFFNTATPENNTWQTNKNIFIDFNFSETNLNTLILNFNETNTILYNKNVSCYQETTNNSTSTDVNCANNYGGAYVSESGTYYQYTSIFDGNWSSYGAGLFADGAYINITYKKPSTSLINSAKWQVRDGFGDANLSIPLSCWNYNPDELQLKAYTRGVNVLNNVTWYCNNGSWIVLRTNYDNVNFSALPGSIYEEAIYWEVNASSLSNNYKENKTSLADGIYSFYVSINDSYGNYNQTETRVVGIDNINPSISFNEGSTQQNGVNISSNIISIVTDVIELNEVNYTVTIYNSTGVYLVHTNTIGSHIYTTGPTVPNGVYTYNATVCDYLRCNSTETRKITLDTLNPNATLSTPTNNTYSQTASNNLTVNITDNSSGSGIKNATLYLYNNTALVNQTTINYGGVFTANLGITVTLIDNVYKWFYKVFDFTGNTVTTQNNTLTVDTLNPAISIVYPTNATWFTVNTTNVNYTASDTNIDSCKWSTDGGVTNTSLATCGTNITGQSWTQGIHNITVYINDSAGRTNVSRITFYTDTIKPQISFNSYTPASGNYSRNSIFVNITASDTNKDTVKWSWNGVNETFTSNTANDYWENKTSLADGTYTFYAWINDSANNFNSTETRRIILDTTPPAVVITDPQNITYLDQYNYTVYLKATITDATTTVSSRWYSLNGGINTTFTPNISLSTAQGLTNGSNTLYVYSNDSLNNLNTTKIVFSLAFRPRLDNVNISNSTTSYSKPTLNTTGLVASYSFENNWSVQTNAYGNNNATLRSYLVSTQSTKATSSAGKIGYGINFPGEPRIIDQTTGTTAISFGTTTNQKVAQSFVMPSDNSIFKGVSFSKAANTGSVTNDAIVRIETDSGGSPSGTSVASVTYSTGSWTAFYTTSIDRMYLDALLTPGVTYWIVFNTSTIDNSNYRGIYYNNTNTYGALKTYNGSTWSTTTGTMKFGILTHDDYVISPVVSMPKTGYSYAWWMKSNTSTYMGLFSAGRGYSSGQLEMNSPAGSFFYENMGNNASCTFAPTGINMNDGNWHNYVMAYNGTAIKLYADGVLRNTCNNFYESGTRNINYIATSGGTPNGRYGVAFNGSLDEIMFFNRSISSNEVTYIYSITNPTFQEVANVTLAATVTDADTPGENLFYSWFVDGSSILTGLAQGVFNYIFTARSSIVTLNVNDTSNYTLTQTWNVSTNYVLPVPSFISPTQNTGALLPQHYIVMNITPGETNYANSTFNVYNASGYLVNTSGEITSKNYTATVNVDGSYYYNVTVKDQVNNVNSTETRQIYLDTSAPLITIIYPLAINYTILPSTLNYTYLEATPDKCWYSANGGALNSTPVSCTGVISGMTPSQGTNTWTLYINDTIGNANSTSITFFVDSIKPAISITYPGNNSNTTNIQIGINYTVSDTNLQTCKWTQNGGATNTSIACGTNISGVTWSEGLNTVTVYSNDTYGNTNSSTVIFRLDTTAPQITIVHPQNISYLDDYAYTYSLNLTYSDAGVGIQAYKWSLNGGTTNTSFTPNTTLVGLAAGSNTVTVWVNDTLGNVNSTSRTFYLAFTPNITSWTGKNSSTTYTNLTNMTFQEVANVTINSTISDPDTTSANLFYKWAVDGVTVFTGFAQNVFNYIFTLRSTIVTLNVNDTQNYTATKSWNISTTYINPTISFTSPPTPLNNTYTTSLTTNINVSGTEANRQRVWVQWDYAGTQTNYTMTCNGGNQTDPDYTCNATITSVAANGIIYYNVYINDSVGQINSTETRKITMDNTNPAISIVTPTNASKVTSNTINVNYTVRDTNLNTTSCKWTNNSGFTNTTLTNCGTNITGQTWPQGTNVVQIYSTDLAGNVNYTSVTFYVDSLKPLISVTYPVMYFNTTNTQLGVNYTASDTNIGTCKWTQNAGATNTTLANCGTNISGVTWTEGLKTVTVYVNDTYGNTNSSTVIFRLDTNGPAIGIVEPQNISYRDNYNYSYALNVTRSDSGVGTFSTFWWSLNGGTTNTTFTPNTTLVGLVAGSNTVTVWVNDTLGNVNTTSRTFYLAFTPKINNINVSNSTTSYSRNDLTTGLVGYWKLDENNTNQIDSSEYSNNGMVINNSYFNSSGIIGGSYSFSQSTSKDYIFIGDRDSLSFNNTFTIAFWMQAKPGSLIGVLGKRGSPWEYSIHSNDGSSLGFTAWSSSGTNVYSNNYVGFSSNKEFYVWSANGTISNLYVNGLLVNSANKTGSNMSDTSAPFTIGLAGGSAGIRYMDGSIDEVRIYNRSLSASEVANLYLITNPTFQEYPNVTINATITDEDTAQGNLFYSWFKDGASVLTGLAQGVYNFIFTGRSTIITLNVNDSQNYTVTQTWNISQTYISPTISFVSPPTPTNNTYLSATTFGVNFTGTEPNLNDSWITMNAANYTATCTGGNTSTTTYMCNYTFTALANGIYNYTAYARDKVENINNSETRKITIDTIAPVVTITSPGNNSNTTNTNPQIVHTETDINLDSCILSKNNGVTNSSVHCNGAAFSAATEGLNTWTIYANDSANNWNSSSVTFRLDTIAPAIAIIEPQNISYLDNYAYTYSLNVTYSDSGVGTFSNFKWSLNGGLTNTSFTPNTTLVGLAAGSNTVTVWVNDTVGNTNSTSRTFYLAFTPNITSWTGKNVSTTYANLTNMTFQEVANVTLNSTLSDPDTTSANLFYKWAVDGVTVFTGFAQNVFNYIFTLRSTIVTLNVNDTQNYTATKSWNISTTYINPTISFTSPPTPLNNTYQNSFAPITINVSGIEANKDKVVLSWSNTPMTMTCNGGTQTTPAYSCTLYVDYPDTDGIRYYNVTINDTVGNLNYTETRKFTVDTTYPLISYGTETSVEGANLSQSNVYINLSITELNFANITYMLVNNSGTIVNSTTYTTSTPTINITGLPDGYYTYYVNITDLANNKNSTAIRTITLDTNAPSGTLEAPANDTYTQNTSINFTASVSDNLGIKNATLNIYNQTGLYNQTTLTFASDTLINSVGIIVVMTDQIYNWFYDLFDWAGNRFTTGNWTMATDTTASVIQFVSPTQPHEAEVFQDYIEANVTISDLTPIVSVSYTLEAIPSDVIVNITTYNSGVTYHKWVNLPRGRYQYFVNVTDSAGNTNTTEQRVINIDSQYYLDDLRIEEIDSEEINITFEPTDLVQWASFIIYDLAGSTVKTKFVGNVTAEKSVKITGLTENTPYMLKVNYASDVHPGGVYKNFTFRTLGWNQELLDWDYKRLVTVDHTSVAVDDDTGVVNITLTQDNFRYYDSLYRSWSDFPNLNMTNGADLRFVNYYDTIFLEYNIESMNITNNGTETRQIIPNSVWYNGTFDNSTTCHDGSLTNWCIPNTWGEQFYNYTVPTGALSTSRFHVQVGDSYDYYYEPIPSDCWPGEGNNIQFHTTQEYGIGQHTYCKNATSGATNWIELTMYTTSYAYIESEMFWVFPARMNIIVRPVHVNNYTLQEGIGLDADYDQKFWMYYGNTNTTANETSLASTPITTSYTLGSRLGFIVSTPHITNLNDTIARNTTSTTINWTVNVISNNTVEYATNPWLLDSTTVYSNDTTIPTFKLNGLNPNMTYYYLGTASVANKTDTVTGNFLLGTAYATPVANIIASSYSEDRPIKNISICGNLTNMAGDANVRMSIQYWNEESTTFNETPVITMNNIGSFCYNITVDYGHTYYYRTKANGTQIGYSPAYVNEFMALQPFFVGNEVEDDLDYRHRQYCPNGVGTTPCYEATGYREGSYQDENWAWVESNITGNGILTIHWNNGTTWNNFVMIKDADSDMNYYRVTNLPAGWQTMYITNASNFVLLNWTKPDLNRDPADMYRTESSKFVYFNQAKQPINYTIGYLEYTGTQYGSTGFDYCIAHGGDLYTCMDVLSYGNGDHPESMIGTAYDRGELFAGGVWNGGQFDTGHLQSTPSVRNISTDIPFDGFNYALVNHSGRGCFTFTDYYWQMPFTPNNNITNYYFRYWRSEQVYSSLYGYWQASSLNGTWLVPDGHVCLKMYNDTTGDWGDLAEGCLEGSEYLGSEHIIVKQVTDKRIFEYDEASSGIDADQPLTQALVAGYKEGMNIDTSADKMYDITFATRTYWGNQLINKHQQGFFILNLPANATLEASDTDGDGVNDKEELFIYYTNPFEEDTDLDSYNDGYELANGMDPNLYNDGRRTNLVSPGNNTNQYIANQNYTVNVTAYTGIKNITVNIYNSTSLVNRTTTLLDSEIGKMGATLLGIPVTLANGFYNWFYEVYDRLEVLDTSSNYSVTIDTDLPIVYQIAPINNTYTQSTTNTFSCNITVGFSGMKNITLFIWNQTSGLLAYNASTDLTGNFNSTSWNVPLSSNTHYVWNCLGYNNAGTPSWSQIGNYTFTEDTINPSATLTAPFYTDNYTNVISYNFQAAIGDNLAIANATLRVYNDTGLYTQVTTPYSDRVTSTTVSTLVNVPSVHQNYTWGYEVADRANNRIFSSNGTIHALIDYTAPALVNGSTSGGGVSTTPSSNITANFTDDISGIKNITMNIYNATSGDLYNSTTYYYNVSTLTARPSFLNTLLYGIYRFYFDLFDWVGNQQITDNQTTWYTPPIINITYPFEGDVFTAKSNLVMINASSNQPIDVWVYELNGYSGVIWPGQNIAMFYGQNNLTLYATNQNGTGNDSVTFYYYPLNLFITNPKADRTYRYPEIVTSVTYNDDYYDMDQLSYSLDGGTTWTVFTNGQTITYPKALNKLTVKGITTTAVEDTDTITFNILDRTTGAMTDLLRYWWAFLIFASLAVYMAYLRESENVWQFFVRALWYSGMSVISLGIIIECIKFIRTVLGI